MRERRFRKYAGIITILLFLAAFIPSALSPAEGTAGSGAAAGAGMRVAGAGIIDQTAEGEKFTRIGVGTIAMGTAIAEATVLAVTAPQTIASSSVAIH